jgi:ankyrin repeat protein
LHLAALQNHHEIVEMLVLQYGADFTKRDKNGQTALDLAIKKSHLKSEWILRRVASTSIFDLIRKLPRERIKDSK